MKDKQKEIMKLMAEKGFNSFDDLSERLNNYPAPSSAKDIEDKLAKLINSQPLFTLTAEEVEDYKTFLEHSTKWNCGATNINEITLNAKRVETLTRIKQWQDENRTN